MGLQIVLLKKIRVFSYAIIITKRYLVILCLIRKIKKCQHVNQLYDIHMKHGKPKILIDNHGEIKIKAMPCFNFIETNYLVIKMGYFLMILHIKDPNLNDLSENFRFLEK